MNNLNLESFMQNYLGQFSGILHTINNCVRSDQTSMTEIFNTVMTENNINLIGLLPPQLKSKTIMDLANFFIKRNVQFINFIYDNIVYESDSLNNNDSEEVKLLRRERDHYKFLFDLPIYMGNLSNDNRKEFIKLFKCDMNKIIEKDIKILNLDLSKTLSNLKEKFGEEKCEEYLKSIRYVITELLLIKIEKINLKEFFKFLEMLKVKQKEIKTKKILFKKV